MYYTDLEWCLKFGYFFGCHPASKRKFLQTVQYVSIMGGCICIPTLTVLMLYYKKESLTVKDITSVSGNFTMFFHGSVKLTTLFMRKTQILELLNYTKYKFWKMDDSDETRRILKKAKLYNRDIFYNSVILFVLATIIKPHLIGGDFLTYKCHRPRWLPRYGLLLIEDLMCITISMVFGYFDVGVSTLLTLTQIQFRMLNKKLKELHDYKLDEDCNHYIANKRLKECVDHYNLLMEFIKAFSRTFSTPIFLFIGTITLSMCLCMYKMSTGNPNIKILIEAFFHLLAGLNQICICYSIPAQALMQEANNVSTNAYFSNWYEHPNQAKDMLMIITRGRKELELTAAGIVKIDMEMFMGACRTMVSYCMFLRTMSMME